MEKPVKPELRETESIKATTDEVAHVFLNVDVDWVKVDAELEVEWDQHQGDMRQYRKDMAENEGDERND